MLKFYKNYVKFTLLATCDTFYIFLFNRKSLGLNFIKFYLIIASFELLLLDDEPLWEPLEWTFAQSFCLYLFLFSWIAETLISSKFGSFTGRDKRVYLGLYRSWWYMEIYFMLNLLVVSLFVIVPFYYEVTYPISYIVSWWDFLDFNFFFQLSFLFLTVSTLSLTMQSTLRWFLCSFTITLSISITLIIFLLFFSYSINFFLMFFTDLTWFKKTGWLDFQSISNGLSKWGWGSTSRDHFSYHKTTTLFWYKNDAVFSSALFLVNFFILMSLIFLLLQWLLILKSLYSNRDISFTLLTYGISSVTQFFYCYFMFYLLVTISITYQMSRIALDLTWEEFLYGLADSFHLYILEIIFFFV